MEPLSKEEKERALLCLVKALAENASPDAMALSMYRAATLANLPVERLREEFKPLLRTNRHSTWNMLFWGPPKPGEDL